MIDNNLYKKEINEDNDISELTQNELELYDLFINEYNDIFENILNLKGKNIYAIIKRNIFLLLGKDQFNQYSKLSQRKVYKKIREEYFEPDNIVIKNLECNLESIGVGDLPIININSIFAHCNKCYECLHICGEPLYSYAYCDIIICLKCKMLYKKSMIRLYCKSCKEEYFSYFVNESNYKDDFFPATWDKYHCFSFNYDQMRCPECLSPLYYSEIKNLLKCFKCNWISSPSKIKWICEICGRKFSSKVKEFVKFESKPEINCVKNALINRICAKPLKCKCCDANPMNMNFFHIKCGGIYYLSYLQKKTVIVCSKCKVIQYPRNVKWICSKCNRYFFCDKILAPESSLQNNFQKSEMQTKANFFMKVNFNKNLKNNFKLEKIKKNKNRCLTSQKLLKFKANDELKNKLHIKVSQGNSMNKAIKTLEISSSNNDSNVLRKYKDSHINRISNFSDSSLGYFTLGKTCSDKLFKTIGKHNIKLEKLTDRNSITKSKNKKMEEEKNMLMRSISKEENKFKEEEVEEIEYMNNNLITIDNDRNEGSSRNKEKHRLKNQINERRNKKIRSNKIKNIELTKGEREKKEEERIQTDINQIKEEFKINSIIENQNFFKKRNKEYIRKKNSNIIFNNPKSERVQSQRKSKNIRFNTNLNLSINALADKKHNNNNFHSITHIKSIKKMDTKKDEIEIEPSENFNIDEFKIVEKIGFGSFGKIYNVKWIRNGKNYAMKIINLKNMKDIQDTENKLKIIDNFYKNTYCPEIIKTYGNVCEQIGIKEYKYYILMELAETDLEEEINYRNKHNLYYSEDEIFYMIRQLVQCLALLQKHNISHRDIKPQNILILNGMYKICDFGEARIISGKNGYIHQPIRGSELYMSPILFDALNNHEKSIIHNSYKSDVFSLGMCLFLAATLSFESLYEIREEKKMKMVRNILEKYLIPHYSDYLVNILNHMLQIDEELRPNFIELENILFCQ